MDVHQIGSMDKIILNIKSRNYKLTKINKINKVIKYIFFISNNIMKLNYTYGQVANYFKNKAQDISKEKTPSAKYRAISYKYAAQVLENTFILSNKVDSGEINKLNITDHMKNKILNLKNIDKYGDKKIIKELSKIMGIGEARAKALVAQGLTNINDMYKEKWFNMLPEETKLNLKLKPEVPIPYGDIKKIEEYLNKTKYQIIIVGSYRRRRPYSNDIDVMVISDDSNILDKLLKTLLKKSANNCHPYSKGLDKMSVILNTANITDAKHIYKLDFFRCPVKDKIPMLLYSTGSKELNIIMRRNAKRKGYLLNQHGLFKLSNDKKIKIENLKTEKDYFDYLGMEYKEPEMR